MWKPNQTMFASVTRDCSNLRLKFRVEKMEEAPKVQLSRDSIRSTDQKFVDLVDLIPVNSYDFPLETSEIIREHKHKLVNGKLNRAKRAKFSRKDKQKLSKTQENRLALVSDVWKFLEDRPEGDTRPRKGGEKKTETVEKSKTAVEDWTESPLEKLQKRIAELQRKRGAATAVEEKEKLRLKRRMSKVKLKGKRKKAKLETEQEGRKEEKKEAEQSEIRNQEGNIVRSKFDFALSKESRRRLFKQTENKRKMKRDNFSGRDYSRLIKKVEARQEKIQKVEGKDAAKAERLKKNIKWSTALQRAEGAKVKDNLAQLKKGQKRKEKEKNKKKNKWNWRAEKVQNEHKKKQEKRKANIKKRVEEKKMRKIGKKMKR